MKRRFAVLGTTFVAGVLAAVMAVSVFAAQITEETAKSIALEHAGVKAESVTYMKSKTDFEKGRLVYEIEFMTSDFKEYDYEIDRDTGEILSWDYDAEYDFLANNPSQENVGSSPSATSAAAVSLEEAKAAALNYAGLTKENVIWGKVEQDFDDGRIIYEGKFYCGTMEYEFEVDAATGTIIDWEMESIYD